MIGIVLSALKTPLYRILEGYLLWPGWLFGARQKHHIKQRDWLKNVVNYAGYQAAMRRHDDVGRIAEYAASGAATSKRLADATAELKRWESAGRRAKEWLSQAENRPWTRRFSSIERIGKIPDLRRMAIAEKWERYPAGAAEEILPTALGNAIHRFELFGPIHYGLDQQRLWYELVAAADERVSKQIDQMRTAVDFFVSLLYGQLLVSVVALTAMAADHSRLVWLGVGAAVGVVIAVLAYRCAVLVTDEWAFAVQALLNLGRKPLAESLSLKIPNDLTEEKEMWGLVCDFLKPKPRARIVDQLSFLRAVSSSPEADKRPKGRLSRCLERLRVTIGK